MQRKLLIRLAFVATLVIFWPKMTGAYAVAMNGPCGTSLSFGPGGSCNGEPDYCSFSTTSCQAVCAGFDNWIGDNCSGDVNPTCNMSGSPDCGDPGGGGDCSYTDCEVSEDCCDDRGCVSGYCEEFPWERG